MTACLATMEAVILIGVQASGKPWLTTNKRVTEIVSETILEPTRS